MAFLVDVAVGIVTEVGKYVFKPIGHQLGYIVFYNRNKIELKEQLQNLETTKRVVDQRVEEARRNANLIHEDVSKWLADVDKALIHDELSNSNPPCFNLLQRHQVSRKTKKRSTDLRVLIQKGNEFVEVGCSAALPDTMKTITPEGYQVLKSKKSLAKQIKDALGKPEVNKVGVYGMGGVGKTYLLNDVKKLVLEDNFFDLMVTVTVGQSNKAMEMQQQIGDILNIELKQSKEARASILRNALEERKGNILIMFDDLWEEYDLIKEVGIPLSKEGCKVLMTSRDQNILTNNMINRNNCFEVTCLNEEESWKFFTTIIGDKFETTEMEIIAKEVVRECGGLPLALTTIAKALKEKPIDCWKDASSKFKNSIAMNIKGVTKEVYASLKLSYDYLDGEETKLLFLLCSVFPDDYGICANDLQVYAMGMRLLKGINTWGEARNSVITLLDNLTSSSLLQLQGYGHLRGDKYVRMHDIVRDVAIHIASTTTNMCTLNYGYASSEGLDEDKCGSYRAIFVDDKNFCNLVPNMKFPKLELLILRFSTREREEFIEIVDAYFEGMENLKVLDMRGTSFLRPFWTSLKNLRMLCMSACECKDINTIGQLKELEILRIIGCKDITELPASMTELKQLKVLVVFNCSNLVVIRPNIISSMTKLEELNIQDCFKEWGEEVWYENTWIQNAQLSELNSLPHLSILRVQILKANILSEDLRSQTLKKLREFFISVGSTEYFTSNITNSSLNSGKYEKTLLINNMESQIGSVDGTVFDILLEKTENLMIVNDSIGFGNVIFKANGNGYPVLKCLAIDGNPNMAHLIRNDFTSLEWLRLDKMMMLESIVPRHAPTNPFNKLKVIKINSCKQLRNLFSFSIFKGLSDLQEIEVIGCDMMDEIVSVEIDDQTTVCTSPLTSLRLDNVDNLTSFCTKGLSQENPQSIIPFFDQRVSFPKLENLSIEGGNRGRKLEMLWHNIEPIASSFCRLQSISIRNCNKLRCVFPSNIVASLVFLDKLHIGYCGLLERVFEIEKPTFGDTKVVPLRFLALYGLPNLEYLWNKDVGDLLTFPNLKSVIVFGCRKLKSIFPAFFTNYFEEIESLVVEKHNEIFSVDEASKLGQVVLFRSLRTLNMTCKHVANERFWVISKFLKLQSLTLVGCEDDDKMITLPMEMSEVLYHIENLKIDGCFQLVQVFGNDHTQRCANLKKLELHNLPKLTQVLKNTNNQMTTITFLNLVDLEVSGCGGMMNLFNSWVAKNLVNLSSMEIYDCRGMTSIVAAEGEGEEEKGEIIFNKLTEVRLCKLPTLASFYSGKCRLKFPSLETLYIKECNEMETFSNGIISIGEGKVSISPATDLKPFFTHKGSFPKLKNLSIVGGNILEKLWHNNGPIASSFCKLKEISISNCNKLRCMFPSNMVTSLVFLNILEITSCDLLERVFEIEKPSFGDTKVVPIPLINLTLWNLPNLKYVWTKDVGDVLAFPNLKNVHVTDCSKLESIFPASFTKYFEEIDSLGVDEQNEIFSVDEASKLGQVVLFQSLSSLRMTCKQAANERFWVISKFLKLQSLTLIGCEDHDKMITLPMEMSEVLYHIENLEIDGCFQLVQVFGNDHTQRCANLKKLELHNLPKLTQVLKNMNNQMTTITFLNLVDLEVSGCGGMMNLFNSLVAKNMVNLSSITISDCRGMTSIVAAEEEINGEIVFNKLTCLNFDNLPRLDCFHPGKCSLKFPRLNTLKIGRCHDMKTFSYGITNTPTLECIQIGGSSIPILPTRGINDIIQASFTMEIEFLESMTNVELRLKTVKSSFWHKLKSFPKLETLTLIGSEDDDIVSFPLEMSEVLYKIDNLEIQNALQLVQVFENEELNRNNHVQRCAKLKKLCLWDLPKLTHVWKESAEVTTITFDSLEYMEVRRCENLKCILPSSISFLNLESLLVHNCNGMMNLFSSSVVKNLGNLENIEIFDCRGMTSIVAATEENGEIVFKKLSRLNLHNLSRLASFHSGKCVLKFPSLESLNIDECNEMETFSVGIVSTPKLKSMKIGRSEFQISPTRDVNVIIQHFFTQTNSMEESQMSCED